MLIVTLPMTFVFTSLKHGGGTIAVGNTLLAVFLVILTILLPIQLGWRPPWIIAAFRWVERLQPWSMMEVYLLGVIVAYVKLRKAP